jgi:hypothetical protein
MYYPSIEICPFITLIEAKLENNITVNYDEFLFSFRF